MSLKQRVYFANAVLLGITVMGAVAMIWYTYKTEAVFSHIGGRNLPVYQAAEALETSLLNQKGYLSYYLLDNNPDWLRQLASLRAVFEDQLAKVKPLVEEPWEKEALNRIENEYIIYIASKDRVLRLYKKGDPNS